mgnify:CR=1 FL=1
MTKAIILAAGMGSRLGEVGKIVPKTLLPVCGRPILAQILTGLYRNGIYDVVVVVGHQGFQIAEYVGEENCLFVDKYNGCYNNVYSLYSARDFLSGDCIIVEGDIFAQSSAFELSKERGNLWSVDKWKSWFDGSHLSGSPIRKIERVEQSKDLFGWKSCGIVKFDASGSEKMKKWITEEVESGNTGLFYDQVLAKHLTELNLRPFLHGGRWIEIDNLNDLALAQEMFRSEL